MTTAGCGAVAGDDGLAAAGAAMICAHGTYQWSGIQQRQKLTALGDPVTLPKGTGHYESSLEPVDDTVHRVTVSHVPRGVGAARVIVALGDRLKTDEPLADPTEVMRPERSQYVLDTGDLEGPYYSWGSIGLVEADFTYTCGYNAPARGHVLTWETVGEGFLPCSQPSDDDAGRTAGLRLCPAGTAAGEPS
ncbi:hypothetical protein JHN63_34345 [Streptomyces sp. MBT65]|uniref:hypothetical protein n=1 Tax=Streptomyces sp. MBT65 TaxID=1488395 RepID=UPI00190D3C0F|nr:hypothetical protein [Streptomyces sp. MBT65]MBK3578793.1 hypothetical protein [Streptomyces sp. MBT65]